MALEHLIVALERDAAEEARSELERARAEAARITRESEENLYRLRLAYRQNREAELRRAAERTLAEARRGGRARVLQSRRDLLERVFLRARRLLAEAADDSEFLESLSFRLEEALSYAAGRLAVVACPPSLVPLLERQIAGRTGLRVQAEPGLGPGLRVLAEDGSLEVDATLECALERLRPEISLGVLRRLATQGRRVPGRAGAQAGRGLASPFEHSPRPIQE